MGDVDRRGKRSVQTVLEHWRKANKFQAQFEEPHPSSKLKLWMGPENLDASHNQEITHTLLDFRDLIFYKNNMQR